MSILAGLLNYNSNNILSESDVWYGLGYCIIGLCVAEKIFRDIQGVFIIFGAWRNALFPGTVQQQRVFERRKFRLKPLGIIRRGIVNWGEQPFWHFPPEQIMCTVDNYYKKIVFVSSFYRKIPYFFTASAA